MGTSHTVHDRGRGWGRRTHRGVEGLGALVPVLSRVLTWRLFSEILPECTLHP